MNQFEIIILSFQKKMVNKFHTNISTNKYLEYTRNKLPFVNINNILTLLPIFTVLESLAKSTKFSSSL